MTSILLSSALSRSSSVQGSKDRLADESFRWESVKNYIYLASSLATSNFNFDIFSLTRNPVRILDIIVLELAVAMSYAFMDVFIRLYTGVLDFKQSLNPLLKGIVYGKLLQTYFWAIVHSLELTDSIQYVAKGMMSPPTWTVCQKGNSNCTDSITIHKRCRNNLKTYLPNTSHANHYYATYLARDRNLTHSIFICGIVWIANFFISSVNPVSLIKIVKSTFIITLTFTLLITCLMLIIFPEHIGLAMKHLFNVNYYDTDFTAIEHLACSHCIGLLGVYDFGSMSPYTLVDNAVVLYTIVFTVMALLRSFIVRILYSEVLICIDVPPKKYSAQYWLYVFFPLALEFVYAKKIFAIYVYLNMIMTVGAHISISTATIARLLHTEFTKVKDIYIIGIICFLGFVFSVSLSSAQKYIVPLKHGSITVMLYLGALKSLIVMWVYGVKRFSTDIQFTLSFKPTSYWKLCWTLQPITLSFLAIKRIIVYFSHDIGKRGILTLSWISVTILIVIFFQLRTVIQYMIRNDLVAAFRSTGKYGPPDVEQRKSRRRYNEATHFRMCTHNCNMLDDRFDCLHQPIIYQRPNTEEAETTQRKDANESSITNIFEAGTLRKRPSSQLEVKTMHVD